MGKERGLGYMSEERRQRETGLSFFGVAATKCHRLGDETTNVGSSQFWRLKPKVKA